MNFQIFFALLKHKKISLVNITICCASINVKKKVFYSIEKFSFHIWEKHLFYCIGIVLASYTYIKAKKVCFQFVMRPDTWIFFLYFPNLNLPKISAEFFSRIHALHGLLKKSQKNSFANCLLGFFQKSD